MIVAGIDSGSRTVKALLYDSGSARVLATARRDSGVDGAGIARDCLAELCASAGLAMDRIERLVATGYGRNAVPGATRCITEITCHARGALHRLPDTRVVIDIGGQDSKAIRLGLDGRVTDFAMNDRCAAGTGRFLEVVAARLGGDLPALGRLAAASPAPAAISSMCVVFAESEIVGLMAEGALPPDIAAGVMAAVATRVSALAGSDLPGPVAFTGGVALLPGFAAILAHALGQPVLVPEDPQLTGALGAALLAIG
jgi:(R)-2-hydroxyacyl-CoA dehydratese activating ATPase